MNLLRIISLTFVMLAVQGQWRNGSCRWRLGYLPVSSFDIVQYYMCYDYYPPKFFPSGKPKFKLFTIKTVKDMQTGEIFIPDPSNKSTPMYRAFPDDNHAKNWVDCCHAAKQCCEKMQRDPFLFQDGKKYCPRTWDGWHCWPDTEAGVVATSECPDHIYFSSKVTCSKPPAEKTCLDNGKWFKASVDNISIEWTDFSRCGIRETHSRRIYVHLSCLGASVAFLIPAIFIFNCYRKLRVPRIYIHTNLFVSLLLSSISAIILKTVVILNQLKNAPEKNILSENKFGCKLLSMLTKYFRLTNYCWMFCEGLYLHRLIAAAFAEQRNLYGFYILGWGFPLIPIIAYSILRAIMADQDCWTVPTGGYEWITNAPMLLALGLNLIFLCDINRVLVTKLRMKNNSQEPTQYRKAVRATLVLIPLFGLHSIMLLYRPPADACKLSEVYSYFNDSLDGLQGFIVSVIFCYTNNEILSLLKRTYNRRRLNQASSYVNSSSARRSTMSLSVMTRTSMVPDATT